MNNRTLRRMCLILLIWAITASLLSIYQSTQIVNYRAYISSMESNIKEMKETLKNKYN